MNCLRAVLNLRCLLLAVPFTALWGKVVLMLYGAVAAEHPFVVLCYGRAQHPATALDSL